MMAEPGHLEAECLGDPGSRLGFLDVPLLSLGAGALGSVFQMMFNAYALPSSDRADKEMMDERPLFADILVGRYDLHWSSAIRIEQRPDTEDCQWVLRN